MPQARISEAAASSVSTIEHFHRIRAQQERVRQRKRFCRVKRRVERVLSRVDLNGKIKLLIKW